MVRSTRSGRGGDVVDMLADPEAAIRRGNRARPRQGGGRRGRNNGAGGRALTQEENQTPAAGAEGETNSAVPNNAAAGSGVNSVGGEDNERTQSDPLTGQSEATQGSQVDSETTNTGAEGGNNAGNSDASQTNPTTESNNSPAGTGEERQQGAGEADGAGQSQTQHGSGASGSAEAGGRQQEEQPLPSCERLRQSLEQFRDAARHVVALDGQNEWTPPENLPPDTLYQAIASVTEAISERGNVLFSLVDRAFETQAAARPGETLLWPQHRERLEPYRNRSARGGHFSLYTVQWDGDANQYRVQHFDSYGSLRNGPTVQVAWQQVRPLLTSDGHFRWNRNTNREDDTLPLVAQVPDGQAEQDHPWTCGLYTIFNAWIYALGLQRADGPPQLDDMFIGRACEMVRLSMRGCMDSQTIRDLLACYHFIERTSQIPEDRTFVRTLALPSPEALVERVGRVRLMGELTRWQQQHPGEPARSFDDIDAEIRQAAPDRALETIGSALELLRRYEEAQRVNQDLREIDEDERLARQLQEEEYQEGNPPPGPAGPGQGPQGVQPANGQAAGNAPGQGNQVPDAQAEQATATGQGAAGAQGANDTQPPQVNPRPAAAAAPAGPPINNNPADQAPANQPTINQPDVNMTDGANGTGQANPPNARQRWMDLLRPPNDPFRPGEPLRPAREEHQAAMAAGHSEMSLMNAHYSNDQRSRDLRERFNLEDRSNAFAATDPNIPQAQTTQQLPGPGTGNESGGTAGQNQPPEPMGATTENTTGQNRPSASNTIQQAPDDVEAGRAHDTPFDETAQSPPAPPAANAAPTGSRGARATSQDSLPDYESEPSEEEDPQQVAARQRQVAREELRALRQVTRDARQEDLLQGSSQEVEAETEERRSRERRAREEGGLEQQQREDRLQEASSEFEEETQQRRSQERESREREEEEERRRSDTTKASNSNASSGSTADPELDDGFQAYNPDDEQHRIEDDEEQRRRDESLFGSPLESAAEQQPEAEEQADAEADDSATEEGDSPRGE